MPADILARIRARGPIGIRLGLGRMEALLTQLGDPQRSLHGVLVGGTNGKGSVSAMVASVLAAGGYSTAQSPSPHLHSYRERVTLGGQPVSADELDDLLGQVLRASEPGEAEFGPATEFELLTAAAYLAAARAKVDVMVMEVGLGGRLDASNAWHADVVAITNVGLDHQEYLGDTVASVAAEKAAIIKYGSRAVTGAQGEALAIIRSRASAKGVSLKVCEPLAVESMDRDGITLGHGRLGRLRLPLLGRHQASNAAVALGAVEALAQVGVATVPDTAIVDGLATTRWPGRLELLDVDGQVVLLDGAHNPDGMAVMAATVDELAPSLPSGRAVLLVGAMRDKDVAEMLASLARSELLADARLIATRVPGSDRAMAADELAWAWAQLAGSASASAIDEPAAALDEALAAAARSGGLLLIAGSLYLVGQLRASLVPGTISDHD